MGKGAFTAILHCVFGYAVIATAIFDGVQRAITEKAIEIIRIGPFVAREIATFTIAEKREAVLGHRFTRLESKWYYFASGIHVNSEARGKCEKSAFIMAASEQIPQKG